MLAFGVALRPAENAIIIRIMSPRNNIVYGMNDFELQLDRYLFAPFSETPK